MWEPQLSLIKKKQVLATLSRISDNGALNKATVSGVLLVLSLVFIFLFPGKCRPIYVQMPLKVIYTKMIDKVKELKEFREPRHILSCKSLSTHTLYLLSV